MFGAREVVAQAAHERVCVGAPDLDAALQIREFALLALVALELEALDVHRAERETSDSGAVLELGYTEGYSILDDAPPPQSEPAPRRDQ